MSEQNSELRRDLLQLAALCSAVAEAARYAPEDVWEAPAAEIAMLASRLHRGLIDRLVADTQNDVTKIIVTGPARERGKGMSGAR